MKQNSLPSLRVTALSLLAATAPLSGCATSRMAVPADIAKEADVLAVSDRSRMSGALADESFKLGPYQVAEVDRDWSSSSGTKVGAFSKKQSTGGYSFVLQQGKRRVTGACGTESGEKEVSLGSGFSMASGFANLTCGCGDSSEVNVGAKNDGYTGKLNVGDKGFDVKSVHVIQGGSTLAQPTGYRAEGPHGMAAVEVLHPGQIWMGKSVEEETRLELTCLLAGLMLYQPPQDRP